MVHQAKTHLSRLLHQVEQGEEIVVCRGKQPVASIVPADPSHISRPKGGKLTSRRFDIPAGAFAPLGDEEAQAVGPVNLPLAAANPQLGSLCLPLTLLLAPVRAAGHWTMADEEERQGQRLEDETAGQFRE